MGGPPGYLELSRALIQSAAGKIYRGETDDRGCERETSGQRIGQKESRREKETAKGPRETVEWGERVKKNGDEKRRRMRESEKGNGELIHRRRG